MKTKMFLVIACLYTVSAAAVDPCQFVGKQGFFEENNEDCWLPKDGIRRPSPTRTGKAAPQYFLTEQALILQEINKNMLEINQTISVLKQSVDALNKVSQGLIDENTKWKINTLQATLDRIDGIPVKLADNKILVDTLAAKLAAQLENDPEFLAKVRNQ